MTKEEAVELWYEKGKYKSDFPRDKKSFIEGWEACERLKALEELTQNNSWIVVEEDLPHNDRNVLIRVKDYRRPEEDIFEASMGYYDNGEWRYMSDMLVNSGHGWMIHSWREIPQ